MSKKNTAEQQIENRDEDIRFLLAHYGPKGQVLKTIEELNELSTVLARVLNGRPVPEDLILDEVADVYNMLDSVIHIFNFSIEDIEKRRLVKINRAADQARMQVEGAECRDK